jgi:hypothetical protein
MVTKPWYIKNPPIHFSTSKKPRPLWYVEKIGRPPHPHLSLLRFRTYSTDRSPTSHVVEICRPAGRHSAAILARKSVGLGPESMGIAAAARNWSGATLGPCRTPSNSRLAGRVKQRAGIGARIQSAARQPSSYSDATRIEDAAAHAAATTLFGSDSACTGLLLGLIRPSPHAVGRRLRPRRSRPPPHAAHALTASNAGGDASHPPVIPFGKPRTAESKSPRSRSWSRSSTSS